MNKFNKYLNISLGLIVVAVVAYFYMFNTLKLTTPSEPLAKKELPQRAQAINYEGAMIIEKIDNLDTIIAQIEANPTAGGATFDLATMAKSITAEALKAFSVSNERALPLIAAWDVGDGEGMDPMYMMKRIEHGEHILVSWKLDPYYNDTIGLDYYETSIKKAAELGLPLVFILPSPESALTHDDVYFTMNKENNPNVITTNGTILPKLSPFGPNSLWYEVGGQWSTTSLMAQIQEWYPNPPLVLFVSQDEAAKLSWSELAESSRYTKEYPSGEDDNYKRTLIDGQWIEKYSQMHDGFKQGFTKAAWKNNVRFMSYNKFSQNLGKTSEWVKDSTITNNYINVWPLTSDGVTVNFDLSGSKNDSTANAPHITANNLPFMLNEAKAQNPNFSYQLNLDDNSKITDSARYRGLAQFALWFLRPSTIRQASAESDTESQESLFQELSDSVELIHYNEQLVDFWKNGQLVSTGSSDLTKNIPEQYQNDPRWFLLDTDANPKRPWTSDTAINVWAFALVKGEAPNRKWLLYVQSPDGNKTDVTVTVPGYKDVLVDASEMGSFYSLSESGKKSTTIVTTKENSNAIDIPIMNIIKRSDWIDVRDMGAKGDGKTDDTQAIQDAFDLLKKDNTKSGVYFPEGTFNISKSLILGGSLYGKTIAGHGRKTIIKWAGSTPNPMLISKGYTYSKYSGLTWDGNNIATIGIYHRSTTVYETHIVHTNEAFKNLIQSGIEVYGGTTSGDLPAAEVLVDNCLFDNTNIGLNIGTDMYNAYDWIIDRCEIRNNKYGIKSLKGEFFLYNTHFKNNSQSDIWSENGSYIRRVTSENSNMFYKDIHGSSSATSSTFQDIHVSNWTAADGIALNYGYRGSLLLFDSSFTKSQNIHKSPVYVQGRDTLTYGWTQHATFSNNKYKGNLYDSTRKAKFVEIPSSDYENKKISSASQTFLDSTTITESKIIEVTGNNSQSIQSAIDKAAVTKDSIVYMPAKTYKFNSSVNVHGQDFTIEGAGASSFYKYDSGSNNDVFFKIDNVKNVTVNNMRLTLNNGETGILMNTKGTVNFNRIMTKDANSNKNKNLFVLQNLDNSSVVIFDRFNDGKINIDNCSDSLIFGKIHLGNIAVSGKHGNGFLGFRWLNSPNISIQDSLNIVIGDFYTEQWERVFDFSGNNGDAKGRITIGGAQKIHAFNKIEPEYGLFDNYNGDIVFMQSHFVRHGTYSTDKIILKQTENSNNKINLVLLGVSFSNYDNKPGTEPYVLNIKKGSIYLEQSTLAIGSGGLQQDIESNKDISDIFPLLQDSLNDLRKLGEYDINYKHD